MQAQSAKETNLFDIDFINPPSLIILYNYIISTNEYQANKLKTAEIFDSCCLICLYDLITYDKVCL